MIDSDCLNIHRKFNSLIQINVLMGGRGECFQILLFGAMLQLVLKAYRVGGKLTKKESILLHKSAQLSTLPSTLRIFIRYCQEIHEPESIEVITQEQESITLRIQILAEQIFRGTYFRVFWPLIKFREIYKLLFNREN